MDATLIVAAFLIAWLLIPYLVVDYWLSTVQRRWEEIESALLGNWSGQGRKPPAYLYAKLVAPLDPPPSSRKGLEELLRRQFDSIQSWRNYLGPLALITLLVGIELAIVESWVEAQLVSAGSLWPVHLRELHGRIPLAVIMALVGAYVWALYEIVSRKTSGDLTPHELDDVVMRLVVAVPIGYAFSLVAIDQFQGAFAFTASAFPLRDVRRILRERALRQKPQVDEDPEGRTRLTPMERVVGALGYDTLARLQDLQISTATDIAFTDPIWLMVRIGFSIRHVLTWMDQALLAIYVGPQRSKWARLGMPCALDACEFYVKHCLDEAWKPRADCSKDPAVTDLAKGVGIPPSLLPNVLREIYSDPHVRFVAEAWAASASTLYPEKDDRDDCAPNRAPRNVVPVRVTPARDA